MIKHSNNVKKTWSVLNEIIKKKRHNANLQDKFIGKNGEIITDKNKIANGFNKFFVEVGPKLAASINTGDTNSDIGLLGYMQSPVANSMFLEGVVEDEIITIVNNCENKTSSDCFGMDMCIVKNIISCVLKPFTCICNKSFLEGSFPVHMETAKVVPLFKAGDKCNFTNYRPVSLLPQFSKILEKLFCNRLDKFIKRHNILSSNQYGFRKNHSTSLALIDLIEELTNSIDNKKITVGIFIDLKKAFDTINHDLLLRKLNCYGIRGVAHKWLSSYIKNRNQYVSYNNVDSKLMDITCGVPQGSILGPILFILYINDLCNVSNFLKFVLFADDANLFASGDNIISLCEEINIELLKINMWFKVNKLSLNLSKTNFMVFSNRKVENCEINFKIENIMISRVFECKFLGVLIDSKLTWKNHIIMVKEKLIKCNVIMFKASIYLNTEALRTLYCSLFLPYINYCSEVWGITYADSHSGTVIF